MTVASATNILRVFNQTLPKEGPRCVPVICDFTLNSQIQIDGSLLFASGGMSVVQGVFIDNSLGALPVNLSAGISSQQISCPPFSQGYFTLLLPNPVKLMAQFGGNAQQTFYFYNIPLSPCVWSVKAQGFNTDLAGNVLVSDQALEALISSNYLRTQVVVDIADVQSICGQINTATTINLVTAAPRFFLNYISLTINPLTSSVGGGGVLVTINQNTTVLFRSVVWVPVTGVGIPTVLTVSPMILNLSDINYKSTVDNENLTLTCNTALVGGGISYAIGACPYVFNQ